MIQRQSVTIRDMPRTTHTPREGSLRLAGFWQRLSQSWSRAWNPCSTERLIDREVRFQFNRRPEAGDELLVNRIVEELSR